MNLHTSLNRLEGVQAKLTVRDFVNTRYAEAVAIVTAEHGPRPVPSRMPESSFYGSNVSPARPNVDAFTKALDSAAAASAWDRKVRAVLGGSVRSAGL